ncbi:ficolin-1-like [Saccostrea cucullata]|uniref:ficolin-1-like n=1 Tax=Saccostrea cuccullata TaxID=36930 RepID=UPI002ED2C676
MQLMTIITILPVIAFSYGDYLESNFEFLGHVPTPVSADSANCSGNLVHLATSSYSFFREFSNGNTIELYCDMETEGGGWIVFQKRMDGSVNFYRNWNDYTDGFGNFNEYYKGNQALYEVVKDGSFKLRIDMEDKTGEWRYAKYSHFSIGGPDTNFTLSVSGYTGNAGDSLRPHNGQQFTTYDRDNDLNPTGNCAEVFRGAWWYKKCHASNLNGEYGNDLYGKGLNWFGWHGNYYSLKSSKMMVRIKRM